MTQYQTFAELLGNFVQQDSRHVRQLSQVTANLFGSEHRVPHNTMSRWLRGGVKKPRNWPDIVKLGVALQLAKDDLCQLLQMAGHDGEALLATDPPISGLFDFWQQPVERPSPFQAPPYPSTFIGRVDVVTNVSQYLCSQRQDRVCCVLGMAGLGKTSLAAYLAYQLRDHFTDGVLWVSLDQTDPMAALHGMAEAYGIDVSIYNDLGTRSSKVRELLATKRALLILDNAECDSELRPLLPPHGHCAVLITSRHHNLVVADTAYRLHLSPFDQAKGESLALFRLILGEQQVEAEANLYTQIADLLGHLPLAINIIAQRLHYEPGWTVIQLLNRLQQTEQRLNLLTRGDQKIRLSFALSYEALDEPDRQLFTLLGIFPSSFTAVYVTKITQWPLWEIEDSLRRLYNLSLLLMAGNRYQLHPLLRDFSQEQLQNGDWQHRFVQTFTSLIQKETDLATEAANIIAAIRLGHQLDMNDGVITAVIAIYPYLQQKGQLEQAKALLKLADQSARQINDNTGLIHIIHQMGFTAMKQGQPDQAKAYYHEALTLAQQVKDSEQTAEIMLKLGALAYRRSQLEEAQQFYSEALTLAQQQQNDRLIASSLTNLGLAEAARGGFTQAIAHYEESLQIARKIEDKALTLQILQNLGNMLEERGDYAQAQSCYEEGLTLADAQQDPELRSRMLGNLGAVACHLNNYAEATAYFRKGLALAEANGLSIQIYRQQANLGHATTLRGQFRQANAHYQEAIRLASELDFSEDLGMILNQAGESYLAQDDYRNAADSFTQAKQIADERQLLRVGPLSLFGLAQVAAARGNIVEAQRLGKQSRQQLAAIGHRKANEVWWWLQELPRTRMPD